MTDEPPPKRQKQEQNPTDVVPQLKKTGITYGDIEVAIKVLNAVADLDPEKGKKKNHKKKKSNNNNPSSEMPNYDDYKHANLRLFRKALAPVFEMQQRTMYCGKTQDEYVEARGEAKYMKGRKAKDTQMQREFLDKTILRKGRIARLNALKEDAKEEELRKLDMLVPDGVPLLNGQEAHFTASGSSAKLLTDANAINVQIKEDIDEDSNKNANENENENEVLSSKVILPKPRSCYTCKVRFRELHPFYDQLCPSCASLNFQKRNFTTDLTGKIAIVTGSRVKIGFQTCLKLLRAGCQVIATTRFPNAACKAYMDLPDFNTFKDRLHVYGLDFRDVTGLEAFTRFIKQNYEKVDILINNACQTIRRPVGYYKPAIERERALYEDATQDQHVLLSGSMAYESVRRQIMTLEDGGVSSRVDANSGTCTDNTRNGDVSTNDTNILMSNLTNETKTDGDLNKSALNSVFSKLPTVDEFGDVHNKGVSYSSMMSQVALLPEDIGIDKKLLPEGLSDVNGQQLDLRRHNSWLLKMEDVSTPEVVETMFINAIAPFVLNSRLKPLMMSGGDNRPDRYIINVSAMEGKFYRYKTPNHPHTNMAKAALNMMTRTSAEDLAKKSRIFMNSVDTGWINDENPLEKASKTAKNNNFQTPIDEVDAAARILDPVFSGVSEGTQSYGLFYKDYKESEW